MMISFFFTNKCQRDLSGCTRAGEVYSLKFLVGECRTVLQIVTLFQTKNVIFTSIFQTWDPFLESPDN